MKRNKKKLDLNRETLIQLNQESLKQVDGGVDVYTCGSIPEPTDLCTVV